jgi:hypothetical protein
MVGRHGSEVDPHDFPPELSEHLGGFPAERPGGSGDRNYSRHAGYLPNQLTPIPGEADTTAKQGSFSFLKKRNKKLLFS